MNHQVLLQYQYLQLLPFILLTDKSHPLSKVDIWIPILCTIFLTKSLDQRKTNLTLENF